MNSFHILVLSITVLCIRAASSDDHKNFWDVVSSDSRLSILAQALQFAGLEEASKEPGEATVFAPTDAAFQQVPQQIVERLSDPANRNELVQLLLYHVVADKTLSSTELVSMGLPTRLETLEGDSVTVSQQGDKIKVNNATVIVADVKTSNGIIHIIDSVLMPPAKN